MATGGEVHVQGPNGLPAEHIAVRIDRDTEAAWETEVFPDWLNYFLIPMLSAGQMWPTASEKGLSELAIAYEKLAEGTNRSAGPAGTAARTIATGMYAPPTAEFINRAKYLYGESAGLGGVTKNSRGHASKVSNFAVETQYSKISINVAFWITVVAIAIAIYVSFFTAGSGARLIGPYSAACRSAVSRILSRLAAAGGRRAAVSQLGRVTTLSGATGRVALTRLLASPLGRELFEEMGEEGFIDWLTQRIQMDKGTRQYFDWRRFSASLVGAGGGAVVGMKLAGPLSRVTRRVGGFAGRALNTGLNNMIASPVGSLLANAAVYGRFENPFTAEAMLGGFLGGVGRTGTISPFNPDVISALTHPTTALATAYDTANRADAARAGGNPGTQPGADPSTGAP
ncbi:WXG100-like domain-containing protein, partial [Nonomuraea sp. SBT364]|uniref:WXG100-like domain-containing protein n=1 Tax=Nonomuraea sp. SBT364 TaxID=1580530 RepID=UPI00066E9790